MASGGDYQIPLREAWTEVQIEIRYLNENFENFMAKGDLKCKLQFALSNDKLSNIFLNRLKRKQITVNKEKDAIIVELQNRMTTNALIEAFEIALKDQVIKKVKFEDEQMLSFSLSTLSDESKDLFNNDTVGLFLDNPFDSLILNIIGPKIDVDYIENCLRVEDRKTKQESSSLETELFPIPVSFDKERKVYVAHCAFDVDTFQYIHAIHFREQLSKSFRNVKYVQIDDKDTKFFIEGKLKQDVVDAKDDLMKCITAVVKKPLPVSSIVLEFLHAESVLLHCKEKLKQVPAHMQVSTDIVVWAPTEKRFERAVEKLLDCFEERIIEGNVEISSEVNEIIKNSDNKIQLLEKSDGKSNDQDKIVYYVVYLRDMSDMAQRMIDLLMPDVKPRLAQRCAQYGENVIRYSEASRLHEEIKRAIPSVMLEYSLKSCSVITSADQEQDAADALKEFDAYARKIEKVEIGDLSEGEKELLLKKRVAYYVAKTLKYRYLLFMFEDEKLVCVGEKIGDGKKIIDDIKKKCIMYTEIVKEILQMDNGREFLKTNADRIVVDESSNKKASRIYHTIDLHQDITALTEKCSIDTNYFRQKCNAATSEFLQIPDLAIVSRIEKKFDVKIGFENGDIVFHGKYENGEKASKEMAKYIPNDEIVLSNGERFKSHIESEEGKRRLDEIAKGKKCCWSMTCQLEGKAEKLYKFMMSGVTHFISWIPSDSRSTVSLVKANFTIAEFDVLIVLVDDKLCGENIFKSDQSLENYSTMMNVNEKLPLQFGTWKEVYSRSFASKTVVLIPSHRVKTSKGIQSGETISDKTLKKVFVEMFTSTLKVNNVKVGFAMPTFSERFLRNVIIGFLTVVKEKYAVNQQAHIYICLQNEAKSVITDVDRVIGDVYGIKRTSRIASDEIKDMFNRPSTIVQVQMASIFDVKSQCLVVLTGSDLDLNKGALSSKVLKESGSSLQEEINNIKYTKKPLKKGELITTGPGKLKDKGVKLLIFGLFPKWKNRSQLLQALQKFVADCIMEADEQKCTSIAFPMLGTGNLHYPPRDVAAAMLDGVNNYKEESMSGKLETVYITTTDDQMHEILTMEQKIRDNQNARSEGDISDDSDILVSNDSRINYSIVKENQLNQSGTFVKVHLLPKKKVGSIACPSHWLLQIGCGTSEEDLKTAVRYMVKHCEEIFITSVYVYCSKALSFSMGKQSKIIFDTVYDACLVDKYPSRIYNYLSNVTIVVQDEAGFSNIETSLTQTGLWYSSWFGFGRKWWRERKSKRHSDVRIKLVGEYEEDIKFVKAAIERYLFSKSDLQLAFAQEKNELEKTSVHVKTSLPVQEKPAESYSLTKPVNNTVGDAKFDTTNAQDNELEKTSVHLKTSLRVQEKPAESYDQTEPVNNTEGDAKSETKKAQDHSTDVSAEVNQGIVKYLQSQEEFFHIWKTQVEDEFEIHVDRGNNDDLKMNVTGSFEGILKFEQYLEEKFPNLPNEIEFTDLHFDFTDEHAMLKIPITEDEKSVLMRFYAKEIATLTHNNSLLELTTDKGIMVLTCKKDKKDVIESKFNYFMKHLHQIKEKEIALPTLDLMEKAASVCLKHSSEETSYFVDKENKQIKLMGTNAKVLDDLNETVSRIVSEAYEEEEEGKGKCYIFGNVRLHIYSKDILLTNVDCIVSSGGAVAKCIADVAGKKYMDDIEKKNKKKELCLCECRTTGSGDLKTYKKVIHVNCTFTAESFHYWQGLQKIQESVQNCLNEADRQGMTSIALPFLCSASSGYNIVQCSQQYIRAIVFTGNKLKKVSQVHLVDKFSSSVEIVCKVFDAYFQRKLGNGQDLSALSKNNRFRMESTTIELCCGNIQASIAQGIVVFVDKYSPLSENNLLKGLEIIDRSDTFKEMQRKSGSDDEVLISTNSSGMYDVVLVALPDREDDHQMEKTVKVILKRATETGFASLALSIPEAMKHNNLVKSSLQGLSRGIVDFFRNKKTTLKYVVIVGKEYKNVDDVSKELEKCSKQDRQRFSYRSYHGGLYV